MHARPSTQEAYDTTAWHPSYPTCFVIAPETAHSLRYVIDKALECKKTGEKKVIAMNYSGHGLLDLSAYEQFFSGKLVDYEPEKIEVPLFER
jgi:predicted alternative tryptophan synthase beta-subunit